MGSTAFRNSQALCSVLAALGSLQPRDFRLPNTIDPLVLLSNKYYVLDQFQVGETPLFERNKNKKNTLFAVYSQMLTSFSNYYAPYTHIR